MDEQDDHQTGCSGGNHPLFDKSSGFDRAAWFAKAGCQEAIHTLYHFLDGELTAQRRIEIADHLQACAPCLGAFDFEAELRLVIARKCRDQVPEALVERIHRALMDASGMPPSGEYQWE
jgi:mycothiol system anti-sigma-R factor